MEISSYCNPINIGVKLTFKVNRSFLQIKHKIVCLISVNSVSHFCH